MSKCAYCKFNRQNYSQSAELLLPGCGATCIAYDWNHCDEVISTCQRFEEVTELPRHQRRGLMVTTDQVYLLKTLVKKHYEQMGHSLYVDTLLEDLIEVLDETGDRWYELDEAEYRTECDNICQLSLAMEKVKDSPQESIFEREGGQYFATFVQAATGLKSIRIEPRQRLPISKDEPKAA